MKDSISPPLGVCVLPEPARNAARTVSYPDYVHEILAHAGLCYTTVSVEELPASLPNLRLLLTVGEAALPDDLGDQLRSWVREGGAWLSVGGVCGMAEMFGAEAEPPAFSSWGGGLSTLGEGYLEPEMRSHPILSHLRIPLHYFNGIALQPVGAKALASALDAHQRPTPRAATLETQAGKGRCLVIAPDVTGTVVRIQQGICVTRDGVPAPDGTAPICDNVLKSGDGCVLDWLFDREPVPGVPGFSAFLQPIADQWREMLLRAIFYLATEQDVALPVLWLYPRNLPALAHLSHDTDLNEPPRARRLLEVLESANINSTWCVIPPGYPEELIAEICQAGHELAMHYDAKGNAWEWSEESFDNQYRQLTEVFGGAPPVTNKNHYLRWEGDTEFFDWCARRGIQLDQSKGPSKTGESGFNFGTCHPYFPVDPNGGKLDVLELPTPTQDLNIFAPPELGEPLLDAARRHHGILHLLFHPTHIEKPGVADALHGMVQKAKEQGLEWWTARQISAWERARRKALWSNYAAVQNGAAVRLQAGDSLPEASIMWLTSSGARVSVNGADCEAQMVERWGFQFQAVTFDIERGEEYTVQITR